MKIKSSIINKGMNTTESLDVQNKFFNPKIPQKNLFSDFLRFFKIIKLPKFNWATICICLNLFNNETYMK